MVRFTLNCPMAGMGIRMEVPNEESLSELSETVAEYWGRKNMMFVRGYELLDMSSNVGSVLKEGDVIEAIPDPRMMNLDAIRGRVQYHDVYGGTWSAGSVLRRTS
ncbi:MAG: hypothetical protein E7Z65_03990 [Thermoplasmata archaeon]|nr:hypothetical protein [Thermoplasmata archaeon]